MWGQWLVTVPGYRPRGLDTDADGALPAFEAGESVTVTLCWRGQPAGVALDCPHGGGVAEEFAGALVEGEVQFGREGGKVGRGGAQKAAEGAVVAGAEAVVEVLVRGVGGG